MDMYETFVPPEYRGKGVAGKLVEAAFKHCAASDVLVRPSCTYISGRFVPKHPEYEEILAT